MRLTAEMQDIVSALTRLPTDEKGMALLRYLDRLEQDNKRLRDQRSRAADILARASSTAGSWDAIRRAENVLREVPMTQEEGPANG